MKSVAVIAHSGKAFGGGLDELRTVLAHNGVHDPIWYEVPKSRKAPKRVRQAIDAGAELIFVWGGDGMVQRCIDELAGEPVTVAVLPAGTANLLATNLGIPKDSVADAVQVGLHGRPRVLDVGVINGERFMVMAGVGFDAAMIRDADAGLKDKAGKLAYVWTGVRNVGSDQVRMKIRVDGAKWFDGKATCLLVGNVGTITGGLVAFADARPDDGVLEVGVVTAAGALQWSRVLARMAAGSVEKSPFTRHTSAHTIKATLSRKLPYELDGGARTEVKTIKVEIEAGAVTICVPNAEGEG
ncbi:diacylglycerol/lipid kinase family protein [Aquihabitans sp. McL0605]|uniref:diacylglycerol/lipid kinase family protein n=1 Tax=Aquihabitans sp. McL0605 TaxID=3415671 RepID=UPI003CF4D32C